MLNKVCHIKFVFFAFFCMNFSLLTAQEERPKIGLVLSGGGAKGFAHVGVLKVLEEYDIPIDYIGGSSIGAIIGGMYALGYTAGELERMIVEQDWEALFMDKPKRIYLPFYEKGIKERYLLSVPFRKEKLFIPNHAITNSGIIKLFSDLTTAYHGVSDFNTFPIPFHCIAVDLRTGQEVLLDSGYLPEAMAASMAIPGIFPSIKKDSMVLVDGGVRNNLPVDHIRVKGADIVIAVDVGAEMKEGEELDKLGAVIDQLTTMLGSEKFLKNRVDCEVYLRPDIQDFRASDFTHEKTLKLIEKGVEEGNAKRIFFKALEQFFSRYSLPERKNYESLSVTNIEQIVVNGTRLSNEDVLGIMGFKAKEDKPYGLADVQVGLERLHASTKFTSIGYKLLRNSVGEANVLVLDVKDNPTNAINFGAHYNTQDNVSLLFNGTFNALLLRNSRLSLDAKLSEVPLAELRYNINRGRLPGLGIRYAFSQRLMKNYHEGKRIGEAQVRKNYLELNTNSLLNHYFTLGLGVRYENYNVNKVLGSFPASSGSYNFLKYRFFFEIDTKDKAYYPTRGFKCNSYTDLITEQGADFGSNAPPLLTFLSMSSTFSIGQRYAITPSFYAQAQYISSDHQSVFYDAYIGGHEQWSDVVAQIPFWGLRWGEYRAQNTAMLAIENRLNLSKKHYIYLNANAFAHLPILSRSGFENMDYKVGLSLGYAYDSFVGPLEFFFSFSNSGVLNTFINIGYYF